jgi:serine/threonine protein kinase
MSLTPGARLGPYEVVASIGAGGMGEVYRAHDTQLGRDVALKVLPEALAHDRERLARFEREARTLASLNHPNIAAIYGLEKTADVTALVMELVDGQDLSVLISGAPGLHLSLSDALPIARQLADALEAAHEQGIVHRDLKPANIKVRADGDAFKDRGGTWSPDGKTIAFYSTRAGKWETWAIQTDGSNLRQLTNMDKDTGTMVWSPDGKTGIVSAISTRSVWRLDPSKLNSLPSVELLKGVADAGLLDVQSWSSSGTLIAGAFFPDPLSVIPAVWDVTTHTLRKLDLPPTSTGTYATFLPDSRRLLVSSARGLMLVDLGGGPPRLLRATEPGDTHRLSRDGRTLVHEHVVFDADIWLLEMKAK